MRKFSQVLEEYLEERDRQNSDYYDNRFIGAHRQGRLQMEDLAKELDDIIETLRSDVSDSLILHMQTGNE